MCGCLSHAPYWEPGLHPRHVPWLRMELRPFGLQASTQYTEPHQSGLNALDVRLAGSTVIKHTFLISKPTFILIILITRLRKATSCLFFILVKYISPIWVSLTGNKGILVNKSLILYFKLVCYVIYSRVSNSFSPGATSASQLPSKGWM